MWSTVEGTWGDGGFLGRTVKQGQREILLFSAIPGTWQPEVPEHTQALILSPP